MTAGEIKLRAYRPTDFETLLRIDHACFPKGIAYGRMEMHVYLRAPGSFCLIGEDAEQVAGFILIERSEKTAHIITIDVLEAYRRQGVGALLLEAGESRAARDGVVRIDLETATTNEPAVAFWRKHGYRESGIIKNYYGRGLDAFAMNKALIGPSRQENHSS